jgi:hypothetical protein
MMRQVALGVLLLLGSGSVAIADEASHREAVFRLLEVTNARQTIDQVMESMDSMARQYLAAVELPPEGRAEAERRLAEVMTWFSQAFEWETMSEFMVDTWVDVFTEEEIQAMVDFYMSPVGRKLVEKQPQMMQRSMQWAAQRVQALMPEFQSRMQTVVTDLQGKYDTADSASDG